MREAATWLTTHLLLAQYKTDEQEEEATLKVTGNFVGGLNQEIAAYNQSSASASSPRADTAT